MRLLKHKLDDYQPFLSSVEQLERDRNGNYKLKTKANIPLSTKQINVISGGSIEIDLLAFSEKLNSLNQTDQIINVFKSAVKQLSFFNEVELFALNDKTNECNPINDKCNEKLLSFVKKSLKNGVLDWIAESKGPKFIPWDFDHTGNEMAIKCFVLPIFSNSRFVGVLTALTNLKFLSEDSYDYRILATLLNLTFSKLQVQSLKKEINKTYLEYQILQSKLFNDYKYAAVGELASKSIEEIGSPLQVIMSYTDILQKENPEIDTEATEFIRTQVHTVKEILNRLSKFINNSYTKPKLYSCSINTAITEFYKVIEHSLKADSYECVLDLEENMPSILSNYNNLNQILVSAFGLMHSFRKSGGGVIIQSRYGNETIVVKMLFTDSVDLKSNDEQEYGISILKHLMEKQEGEVRFNSDPETGTNLIISFPLKRKLRG